MKILILEGIATSGKSTVINELLKRTGPMLNARVYTEESTHVPIMNKTTDLCIDFFKRLVSESFSGGYDLIIFDRLYLTQAYRAGASLEDYLEVELMLYTQQCMTLLLMVDDDEIPARISRAVKYRDSSWGDYVRTKGQTLDAQANYYKEQQRGLLNLINGSILPYEAVDVTSRNYRAIAETVKKEFINVL